jgi:hypothetical protein
MSSLASCETWWGGSGSSTSHPLSQLFAVQMYKNDIYCGLLSFNLSCREYTGLTAGPCDWNAKIGPSLESYPPPLYTPSPSNPPPSRLYLDMTYLRFRNPQHLAFMYFFTQPQTPTPVKSCIGKELICDVYFYTLTLVYCT